VVVPKKFCVLEFIKYSGTQCPMTHLKSYCNKMAKVVHDEKLLMHFFHDSELKWGNIELVHDIGQHKNPKMERSGGCFCQAVQV